MQIAVFSTEPYDRRFLAAASAGSPHHFHWLETRLELATTPLAAGCEAVCVFVNDTLDAPVLAALHAAGTRLVVLRCAGFNNVDLNAAKRLGIAIGRVPAYSPNAVAEHALALLLTLNRRIHRAYNRVREGNFALDGLLGLDLHGKTAGVVGTGQIGLVMARILAHGLGCRVLAYDPYPNEACTALGARYCPLEEVLAEAEIISLHCPLTPETRHLINPATLAHMRPGAMLINTSRGALIDTPAAIEALKSGHLGALGIDVYEEEAAIFFKDHSGTGIEDDVLARLMTFPNVLVTGHQGFFTAEALTAIATTTLANIDRFAASGVPLHPV